jgi:hypothetical protein
MSKFIDALERRDGKRARAAPLKRNAPAGKHRDVASNGSEKPDYQSTPELQKIQADSFPTSNGKMTSQFWLPSNLKIRILESSLKRFFIANFNNMRIFGNKITFFYTLDHGD